MVAVRIRLLTLLRLAQIRLPIQPRAARRPTTSNQESTTALHHLLSLLQTTRPWILQHRVLTPVPPHVLVLMTRPHARTTRPLPLLPPLPPSMMALHLVSTLRTTPRVILTGHQIPLLLVLTLLAKAVLIMGIEQGKARLQPCIRARAPVQPMTTPVQRMPLMLMTMGLTHATEAHPLCRILAVARELILSSLTLTARPAMAAQQLMTLAMTLIKKLHLQSTVTVAPKRLAMATTMAVWTIPAPMLLLTQALELLLSPI